ncbi:Ser/Thr protein phosphatase family protein [Pelomyxa schiedti]|nr:Ser/Thr protein phosphatase family protein [Pelomyxa schiedti]
MQPILNQEVSFVLSHSGKVLDVAGASTNQCAPIIQYSYHGGSNQRFVVELLPGDPCSPFAHIRCVGSGLYLDVEGGSLSPCANVIQYPYHCGDNQLWKLEEASSVPGAVVIRSKKSGLVLDIEGASLCDGAKLLQYPAHGGRNQAFFLRNPDQKFRLFVLSDPQYPWYDNVYPSGGVGDQCGNSARQITQQFQFINAAARGDAQLLGEPLTVRAALINGDLTAFGHDWQYNKFCELLSVLKVPTYQGLGNHDIQNNVNDSFENNCAHRMVYHIVNHARSIGACCDVSEDAGYQFPSLRHWFRGSLAYSLKLAVSGGRYAALRLIQLHNFPGYTSDWSGWNFPQARRDYVELHKSEDWLAKQVAEVESRGEIAIVCVHDWDQSSAVLEPLLRNHPCVVAVFAGHLHSTCGKYSASFPVFLSGAAATQQCLVADFDIPGRRLTVRVVRDTGLEGVYSPVQQWVIQLP